MESENWQKENLEKSKEALMEHFEEKKRERIFREMFDGIGKYSNAPQIHSSLDWDVEEAEFDDFSKQKKDFIDKLIWDAPIERKSVFNKIKDAFSSFYWGLRYILWLIKRIIAKKQRK